MPLEQFDSALERVMHISDEFCLTTLIKPNNLNVCFFVWIFLN